jgi:hypothetical protein
VTLLLGRLLGCNRRVGDRHHNFSRHAGRLVGEIRHRTEDLVCAALERHGQRRGLLNWDVARSLVDAIPPNVEPVPYRPRVFYPDCAQ